MQLRQWDALFSYRHSASAPGRNDDFTCEVLSLSPKPRQAALRQSVAVGVQQLRGGCVPALQDSTSLQLDHPELSQDLLQARPAPKLSRRCSHSSDRCRKAACVLQSLGEIAHRYSNFLLAVPTTAKAALRLKGSLDERP